MCDTKEGCTCGNTYCADDDLLVDVKIAKDGRKQFYIDVGDLPADKAVLFVTDAIERFKTPGGSNG